jgi:hypothetical protein
MSGVDQHKVIPLLFREGAEKGDAGREGRHFLKCGDFGTELVDGGGLVVTRSCEPPLRNLGQLLKSSRRFCSVAIDV